MHDYCQRLDVLLELFFVWLPTGAYLPVWVPLLSSDALATDLPCPPAFRSLSSNTSFGPPFLLRWCYTLDIDVYFHSYLYRLVYASHVNI
jgi:hypothetical protein